MELNRYWRYWNYIGNEWKIITFKTSPQPEAQITRTKVEEIRLSAFFLIPHVDTGYVSVKYAHRLKRLYKNSIL